MTSPKGWAGTSCDPRRRISKEMVTLPAPRGLTKRRERSHHKKPGVASRQHLAAATQKSPALHRGARPGAKQTPIDQGQVGRLSLCRSLEDLIEYPGERATTVAMLRRGCVYHPMFKGYSEPARRRQLQSSARALRDGPATQVVGDCLSAFDTICAGEMREHPKRPCTQTFGGGLCTARRCSAKLSFAKWKEIEASSPLAGGRERAFSMPSRAIPVPLDRGVSRLLKGVTPSRPFRFLSDRL